MADQPVVDWVIPFAPVFSQVAGIPPVRIESAICKHGQLGSKVGEGVEQQIEHDEPDVAAGDSERQRG